MDSLRKFSHNLRNWEKFSSPGLDSKINLGFLPAGNGADGLGAGQRVPRHAAEGLRAVARGDVADVQLAAGEHRVAAVVLAEVGPGV